MRIATLFRQPRLHHIRRRRLRSLVERRYEPRRGQSVLGTHLRVRIKEVEDEGKATRADFFEVRALAAWSPWL